MQGLELRVGEEVATGFADVQLEISEGEARDSQHWAKSSFAAGEDLCRREDGEMLSELHNTNKREEAWGQCWGARRWTCIAQVWEDVISDS